ncbi:flagellar biosynthesis anti-sigma factor FlgM [Frateuria aurantia]
MVNSIKPGSLPDYSSAAAAGKTSADTASTSTSSTGGPLAGDTDRVELTPQAQAITEASQQTGDVSVNSSKVQALQQQIASGTYQVNAQSIAAKLSQFDSSLGGG